jgi:ABC-2 type transport system ATP-binding protein
MQKVVSQAELARPEKTPDNMDLVMSILKNSRPPENVITVQHLSHSYGRFQAVCGVSFNVRRGEVFALLGPNGAGKTTIVEILECLQTPTRGFVNVLGDAVLTGIQAGNMFMGADRNLGAIKEKIGVLPQGFNAFDRLTVRENVQYFAGMYAKHVDIDGLIAELDLEEKKNTPFGHLSGGLKQRVGIALALVNDPEIVFLDEPTAGLDPHARREVWGTIKALKVRGKTVFLTTHYMDEAYHLADRICVIHRGLLVAEGTPDELIDRYGGGSTLVLRECTGDTRDELLKALPGSQSEGNDVLLKLPEGGGPADIARAASLVSTAPGHCKEIYVKKPTLDDVFLNLTGATLAGKVS